MFILIYFMTVLYARWRFLKSTYQKELWKIRETLFTFKLRRADLISF